MALGLVAAFAIGLPKAHGEEGTASDEPISLPDTLPGGYPAADDPAAFKGTDYESQAEDIAKQQKESTDYGNQVLPDALGRAAATRTYVADGSIPVFVQAFRAEGGAFAPQNLIEPTGTSGGTTMQRVGDAVCILTYSQSTDGSDKLGDPAASQCQTTRGGVTVQIQASGVATDDLVAAADGLLDQLVGEDTDDS